MTLDNGDQLQFILRTHARFGDPCKEAEVEIIRLRKVLEEEEATRTPVYRSRIRVSYVLYVHSKQSKRFIHLASRPAHTP